MYEFVRIALVEMSQAHDAIASPAVEPYAYFWWPLRKLAQISGPDQGHRLQVRRRSPATKLDLYKTLVGSAKGSTDQQTLNDNNFDGAWRILATKFDNVRMAIQDHVPQLLSLRSMTKGTHAELKELHDVVEKRLESLEFHKFKMQDKLSETILVNLLIPRLDLETRLVWQATLAYDEMSEYKKTMHSLRKHCYVLE